MGELAQFLESPAGLAVKAALAAAFIDFATGVLAASRDGTFALDAIAAFVRKHLMGRVLPLASILAAGYFAGDELLIGGAVAGLTAYAAETVASVWGNLNPPKASEVVEANVAEEVNPVPTD